MTTQEVMNSEHGTMVCIPRTVLLDARRALSVAPVPAQEERLDCSVEGVHTHPFRGPHRLAEVHAFTLPAGLRAQDEGGAVDDQ